MFYAWSPCCTHRLTGAPCRYTIAQRLCAHLFMQENIRNCSQWIVQFSLSHRWANFHKRNNFYCWHSSCSNRDSWWLCSTHMRNQNTQFSMAGIETIYLKYETILHISESTELWMNSIRQPEWNSFQKLSDTAKTVLSTEMLQFRMNASICINN